MLVNKLIKSAKELTQDSRWIIWGLGALGRNLYQQTKVYDLKNIYLYDLEESKVLDASRRLSRETLREALRNTEETKVIIAAGREETIEKIHRQILEMGRYENIYRFVPETGEELGIRLKSEGFENEKGTKSYLLNDLEARQTIEQKIKRGIPFLFSRWGSVEGRIVYGNKGRFLLERDIFALKNNAGVYPTNEETIQAFVAEMTEAANNIDFLCAGLWCLNIEDLFKWYSPNAVLINSDVLNAILSDKCLWLKALEEKKVLVIHPFAPLMKEQYKKREKLFPSKDVLPQFDLLTYQAVQSMGGNSMYASWVEALKKMENDIEKITFDVALIGCGAYGMPLGSFVKTVLGKPAIHMGGILQILFGIKGKRWDKYNMYNEYWTQPTDDLKPANYLSVEGGCYWW